MFSKNKIVLELDERYFNLKELRNAVVEHLINEGKNCKVINDYTLKIDGNLYVLKEKNMSIGGVPLQQVILTQEV